MRRNRSFLISEYLVQTNKKRFASSWGAPQLHAGLDKIWTLNRSWLRKEAVHLSCVRFIAIKTKVLFRAKICMCFYLVTWWMLVKLVHLYCILYQMNAKCQISRHKFSVPDRRFFYNKAHHRPFFLNKFESKI
jgi:hypothetical protein